VKPDLYFYRLLGSGVFRFDRLNIDGIDNEAVMKFHGPDMIEQETCLFHQDISSGNQYLDLLHSIVERSMEEKKALPVVRFADGEYAFYRYSLECNGLYQQAMNAAEIKKAMPSHVEALRTCTRIGKLAPLVFPGNSQEKKQGLFSFLRKSKKDDSAIRFLDFLAARGIDLNGDNYIPFYAVYAYLASGRFARLLEGKSLCIVNSEFRENAFRNWFEAFSARPRISHAAIPDSYVATRWNAMRDSTLSGIPKDADLCLVGAGIGALQVCVDVAAQFSIPAIDAGHIMNMMNGLIDKSKGPRLYTIWKDP